MLIKSILDQGIHDQIFTHYACSFETHDHSYHFFSKDSEQQFDLASLTKIYATKILYHFLLQKKVLSIEDNINNYDERLPSYTFKNLFNHETLFLPWAPLFLDQDPIEGCLKYHLNSKFEYSDLNYVLLWELSKIFTSPLETLLNFYQKNFLNLTFFLDEKNFITSTTSNLEEIKLTEKLNLKINFPPRPLLSLNDYNAYKGVLGHAGLLGNSLDISYLNKIFYQEFQEQPFGFKNEKNFQEDFYLLGHDAFTGCYSFIHEKFSFVFLTNHLIYGKKDLKDFRKKLLMNLIQTYLPTFNLKKK